MKLKKKRIRLVVLQYTTQKTTVIKIFKIKKNCSGTLQTNVKNARWKSDVEDYGIAIETENRFPKTRKSEEEHDYISYEWRGWRQRRSIYKENHTNNRVSGCQSKLAYNTRREKDEKKYKTVKQGQHISN